MEGVGDHFFADLHHIVLCGKRHLIVQLVKLTGRTVLPGVFIAEAGGNLEILIERGYHQQLLKLLRSLGERIELALVFAAWNQKVARAFGRGSGQNRGLDFQESFLFHLFPHMADYLGAQDDVVPDFGVAQVQITVFQPDILAGLLGVVNVKGEHIEAGSQHLQLIHNQLHAAGVQLFIHGILIAFGYNAGNRNNGLLIDIGEQGLVMHYRLRNAGIIPDVHKDDAAVIADGVDPAGKLDGLPDVGLPNVIAVMSSVHKCSSLTMVSSCFLKQGIRIKQKARPEYNDSGTSR